jgi:hypothetical protein
VLGSLDLLLGEAGDRGLCFQGGQQVGERLFAGFMADRDLAEVHPQQPVGQHGLYRIAGLASPIPA